MRISDWSSDVCSSDLAILVGSGVGTGLQLAALAALGAAVADEGHLAEACFDGRRRHHHVRQEGRAAEIGAVGDRKSVVEGKSVSVRVNLGGRRLIKKKIHHITKHKLILYYKHL